MRTPGFGAPVVPVISLRGGRCAVKKCLLLLFIPALFLALSACASSGAPSTDGEGKSGYYDRTDYETMNRISRDARERGHRVIWINPPRKPRSDEGDG